MIRIMRVACVLALALLVTPAQADDFAVTYIHNAIVISTTDKTVKADEADATIAGIATALGKPGALPAGVSLTVVSDKAVKGIVSAKQYPAAQAAQESLDDLYTRLLAIKTTQEFFDSGFGAGKNRAWKQEALAARDKADNEKLPYQLKGAFGALVDLGELYLDMRQKPIKTIADLDVRENALFDLRANVRGALDMTITP